MKKLTVTLLAALYFLSATGQDTLTKDFYLQRSKNQKTAAWVLLGGGALATIGGAIWFNETFSIDIFGPDKNPGENTAGFVMIAGVGAMLGSIPLFISSAHNKKRAESMAVFIGTERLPVLAARKVNLNYPVVGVRIGL